MIIVMEPDAPPEAIDYVARKLEESGQAVQRMTGSNRTIFGVVGDPSDVNYALWKDLPQVADVVRIDEPFRLSSRRFRKASTIVAGAWGNIGGDKPWLAVEPVGLENVSEVPHGIAAGRPFDAAVIRGKVVPSSMGALACLPLDPLPGAQADVVFVNRGPSWGANKWIGLAERELAEGRQNVVLLEAGGEYPNGARTLEMAAIARAKIRTHLPIVVDAPSIAQRSRYVAAIAQAAIAGGADGVILRAWVGEKDQPATMPATLPWDEAVALGVRLRAIAAAART